MTNSIPFPDRVLRLRQLSAHGQALAAKVWALVVEIQDCELLIPERAIHEELRSRFQVEEADEEGLTEIEQEIATGHCVEEGFVRTYPFLRRAPAFFRHAGLVSFSAGDFDRLKVLPFAKTEGVPSYCTASPEGLTTPEWKALVRYHESGLLKLLSEIRHVYTAAHYVVSGARQLGQRVFLDASLGTCKGDARAVELSLELIRRCEVPGVPPASRHFGTEADRINPLQDPAVLWSEPVSQYLLSA